MGDNKKNHHYVFQAYLKVWKNENEQVYCLRNGIVFPSSTRKIACKRYFYKIHPLNENEYEFMKKFCKKGPSCVRYHCNSLLNLLHGLYLFEKRIADVSKICDSKDIQNFIDFWWNGNNQLKTNVLEDYYSEIESVLLDYIKKLINGDTNFLDEIEKKNDFLHLVYIQYFRTKKAYDIAMSILNNELPNQQDSFKNVLFPLLEYFRLLVEKGICMQSRNIALIHNSTDLPFITCDQPVINLCEYNPVTDDIDKFILYYPLSPKIALIVNDDSVDESWNNNEEKVKWYNGKMVESSYEQIYSNNKEVLECYRDIITKRKIS